MSHTIHTLSEPVAIRLINLLSPRVLLRSCMTHVSGRQEPTQEHIQLRARRDKLDVTERPIRSMSGYKLEF